MVADAVRIIDNYIKVSLPHLLALALMQNHKRMHCHLLETQVLWCFSVRYLAYVAICLAFVLSSLASHTELCMYGSVRHNWYHKEKANDIIILGKQHVSSVSNKQIHVSMQAFYIPWGDELHRWALTHPEYTQSQILMLVTCIAESNSLKRKDRNALTSQIEADLADMRWTWS